MKQKLLEFKELGVTILPSVFSDETIGSIRNISLELKSRFGNEAIIGTKKQHGVPTFWKGLDMASQYNEELYKLYTSKSMLKIAGYFLNTSEVYLYNDQVVVKSPKEDFEFESHCDNQYGPNLMLAQKGVFKTITCCLVLDDFTEHNGAIKFTTKVESEITPLPKSGSLIVWDGNTIHSSTNNLSNGSRCVWLLIYANTDIHKLPAEQDYFNRFYNQKFTV
ncbi:phytanoyl-CoA dioxygenase family protein [Vicingaceae bacterium]|nr:phytanoyl-CoA dioxygenase family protein [Vicingaceae bacterium]MDC1452431.1 phytanoyl-CoA dioxygenase family protein [Vicingaceae bacterium]|tara:strand:+ start:6451 stop:7113 length:663 start_codon:yes stop_codon:yes gene_type:complete